MRRALGPQSARLRKSLLGLVATAALVVAAASVTTACKGPMARIEALREALVHGDASAIKSATEDLPRCGDVPPTATLVGKPGPRDEGCLSEIANALGSKKGFAASPPDHAAAATAAVALVRDGRGDYVVHADNWLGALKSSKGPGYDTLRLAVATKMVEAAPKVGRAIEDETTANDTLKAIASAIPGACPTYWLLGAGTPPIAPELMADHSACVQRDLRRREGPGVSYGEGTFRALEGALAVWRETERALRVGLANASPDVKATVETKLGIIEPLTQKAAPKRFDATVPRETLEKMGEFHAGAGVVLWKMKDAGADGAVEGGAPDGGASEPHDAGKSGAGDAGKRLGL